MKVAVVQTNPTFGEVEKNVRRAIALMEMERADLYVLPELFNTGYDFKNVAEVKLLSETGQGHTFQLMNQWARKNSCYLVYGFAEKAEVTYNSAVLIDGKGIIGLYRKVHLYARENILFSPGRLGFPIFELPFGKLGMMICFDWIYPESARSLALQGAQLIAHPSNLVLPYCPDAMVSRCLENRVFAATADRVGEEERNGTPLHFIGASEIVSPNGTVLCRLDDEHEGMYSVEIDLADAKNKKITDNGTTLITINPPGDDIGRS
jgi:predicted amidohydrolase